MKTIYLVVTQDPMGYGDTVHHGAYEDRDQAELVSQDYDGSEVVETELVTSNGFEQILETFGA